MRLYLDVLVAPDAPSLATFFRFHSHHDESEVEMELSECHTRWGEGLVTEGELPALATPLAQNKGRSSMSLRKEYSERPQFLSPRQFPVGGPALIPRGN